jgi:cell division protein FtsW
MNRLGRGDRSPLGVWFWELDRVLLALMLVLIAIGLLAVAAASPAGAQRLSSAATSLNPLYFFYRQLVWLIVAVPAMLVISMYPRDQARRFAVVGFGIFFVLLALVPVLGREVNGSQRWIGAGFAGLQPSEFLKPFFAVTMAWIISWRLKDPTLPVRLITSFATGIVCMLLMAQPDLGQTILFAGTWFALMMVSGVPASRLWAMVIGGAAGLILAYNFYPVATQRIDAWIFGTEGLTHDKMAMATLTNGGFIGVGPGLGTKKYSLPEGHTDYIFSVIGEEFGLLACIVIALLYFAILVRIVIRLLDEKDQFVVLAVTALAAQFCGQAMINIAVNLGVFPSKGMTLPFISYGGSSILALSVTCGLILALTKRNPYLDRSAYMVKGPRP